ncbi:hypothetical protein SAMN05421821_10687 [Mucilaginibacter lappiensis]|uniref:Uncharacterized protein n=1 Tax=Mucilaginibacter lappiensis TaxID=354630 RepID=A0ABR6PMQ7_9SPHI|nr:hypothetical protein [Mucilaginibacter lappiensis]SIR28964.1 hypothetical protein SAMN05421821_10687 [Mucilaginibacter lappiensis]
MIVQMPEIILVFFTEIGTEFLFQRSLKSEPMDSWLAILFIMQNSSCTGNSKHDYSYCTHQLIAPLKQPELKAGKRSRAPILLSGFIHP